MLCSRHMRQSCSSTFILDCFKCICLSCFFLFFFWFFCVCFLRVFSQPWKGHHTATSEKKTCHAQDTTLPRQKGTPATHRRPHCHVRTELLPHQANRKKNKRTQEKNTRNTKKNKTKKNTQKKKNKTKPKKTFETSEMHVAEKLWNWGMSNFKGWSVFHGRGTC